MLEFLWGLELGRLELQNSRAPSFGSRQILRPSSFCILHSALSSCPNLTQVTWTSAVHVKIFQKYFSNPVWIGNRVNINRLKRSPTPKSAKSLKSSPAVFLGPPHSA